jgi:putative transposase
MAVPTREGKTWHGSRPWWCQAFPITSPNAATDARRFFKADDYRWYRRLIGAAARRAGAAIWAYCLMPNHVHLIVTPADEDGLRATFAEAHRRYTGNINARFRWTGHLFQGRFGAVAMDEEHLLASARYIALNPVTAGLVTRAEDWPGRALARTLRPRTTN